MNPTFTVNYKVAGFLYTPALFPLGDQPLAESRVTFPLLSFTLCPEY